MPDHFERATFDAMKGKLDNRAENTLPPAKPEPVKPKPFCPYCQNPLICAQIDGGSKVYCVNLRCKRCGEPLGIPSDYDWRK